MMGRQSRQMAMVFVDMESLIPENHLLRKIDRMVSFDFIYELLAPYYSATGRPSVDPASMFKMLLVGYLYGIKSERRLVEEVRLNIAYRWFCGFELDDAIPDHSTFSKARTRKWQQSGLFQNAFYEIVKQCIACGLIDGKAMAADGSYIPANVSRESWVDVEIEIVPLKCFTEKYGRISDVLAAIYGGVDDFHCQILNMSLGISQSGLNSSLQGNPRALDEAMAYAREKGVILVAAVGNVSGGSTGNDTVMFPAGYETVIGVGSVDKDKAVAVTSCRNESVFLAAPGDGLYGLGVSSNSSYITGSGTSFAAPMVTAAAALALSVKPDLSQEEFMYLLRETAEDLGELGWDSAYGYGLLDIGKLLETIETGWYQFEENGQEVLAVNLEGLTPNSTVFLVQAIRNVMGAQMNVKITEKTASADGNLHCNLILEPIASDETRVLFTLNRHLCPLKSKYITTTCLAS